MRHPPTAPAGSTPAGVYLAPSGAPSVAAAPLSRVAGNVGTGVRGGVGGCEMGPGDRATDVSGGGVGPRAFLRIPGRKNNESEIISKSTSTRGLLERLYDMGQILRGHHHGLTMVSTWITISTRLTFTCWFDHARRKIE